MTNKQKHKYGILIIFVKIIEKFGKVKIILNLLSFIVSINLEYTEPPKCNIKILINTKVFNFEGIILRQISI